MALIRQACDRFTDTTIKAVMQQTAYEVFKTDMAHARVNNPFGIAPAAADALEKLGIATDPFATRLHTHAECKAIENRMLEVVGHALPKEPVTFYFLKRVKLQYLRRDPRIKDIFNNHLMEPRDVARYDPDTLRSCITAPTTPTVYISDALHFLPFHFLASMFKHNPIVHTVHATMVLPPEALYKHPSQNPDLYSINYDFEGFQYIPGSHGGGAYHHEFDTLKWLRVGKIIYFDEHHKRRHYITVQMTESLGANHMFTFTRGDMLTPRVRTFRQGEFVTLPQLFHPKQLNSTRPIPATFAMQLLLYVKSVKEVTHRDVFAKIRQLIPTQDLHRWSPDELVHIANFFFFASKRDALNSYDQVVDSSLFTRCFREFKSQVRTLWETLCGKSDFRKLMEMLDWKPFTYSLEVTEEIVDTPWFSKPTPFHSMDSDPWQLPEEEPEDPEEEDPTSHSPAPAPAPLSHTSDEAADLPWGPCLNLLHQCGFKGTHRQHDPDGHLISPIMDLQALDVARLPSQFATLQKKLEDIRRQPTMHTYCHKRAAAYASDVKNNRVGLATRNQTLEWKQVFSARCESSPRQLPTVVIHGAGGSGKSQFLQVFLRDQERNYDKISIVTPTVELRADWMRKVPNINIRCFRTHEKALLQPASPLVIIDDYTKIPTGLIEAYIISHPEIEAVILTGDPQQSHYHEACDQAMIASLEPASTVFEKSCRYYINATHRNRQDLANKLGVYSEVEGDTKITLSGLTVQGWPLLSPSQAKKECLRELGNVAYSYAGCQGLTTPCVQILLDNNTALCSKQVMYTALSRARDAIHFINTGPTSADFWNKVSCTPYLSTFLDMTRKQPPAEAVPTEPEVVEPNAPTTHFPIENKASLLEPLVSQLNDKFDRELYDKKHGHTNTIQTEDAVVQLFQHQQAKDEALLFKTIEARIAIATPEDNEKEFIMKQDIGDILFLNYQRAMGLPADPIPFSQELWDSCRDEVQQRYLSKPIAALINGMPRQSPDFPKDKIALFLKSQWVTKTEKIGALKVKPGQTIASFMQQTVMIYGTMARYMRRIRASFQPENIFITCENTPEDLNEWVKERWNFSRPGHSNDFTAFDQSQDGAMLQFEVTKAKFHNTPEDIIEGYIQLKTNAHIFLGTVAIMRLSGEGPTFDANTECAIAYHHTKYHVSPNTSQLYAGDDMAQDDRPIPKDSFRLVEKRLTLTSKEVCHSQKPGDFATFCGWTLTPKGIIKDPKKLYAGLCLAKGTDRVPAVRVAYAHDLRHAYRLGDELHEVLTEEQASFHQATVRDLHLMGCNEILQNL
jgi:hypothetical protein